MMQATGVQTLAPEVEKFPPWAILVIAFEWTLIAGGLWLAWLL